MTDMKAYWSESKEELEKSEDELYKLQNIVRRDTEKNDQIEKEK